MRVLLPLAITDARLTSTTVPEVPPAAYNAGATYAADALCSTGTAGGVISVWRSLLDNNTNHDPASNPTWWTLAGETYVEYSGATFAKYDRVIDATAHMVYESLVDPNTGNALSDTNKWAVVGPTNRHAMFDLARNTRTIVPGSLTVRVTPGQRCDSITLAGLAADAAAVNVIVDGAVVFTLERSLGTRYVDNHYAYAFEPFSRREIVVSWVLPPYTTAVIEVTLTAQEGNVECATCAIGRSVYFGKLERKSRVGAKNQSEIKRDRDGNAELRAERNIPTITETVWVAKSRVAMLRGLLANELNGVPAVYSGLDDDTDGYFDPLFLVGIVVRYEFGLDYPNDALLSMNMEEI